MYSGWPKVFVKYGVGNMENKNRRQRNTDIVYLLQRQGKTIISINKIMCSHVNTYVTVTSDVCMCMFLYAKDQGAEGERDVTGLEKDCHRSVQEWRKNIRHCKNIAAAKIYNIRYYQKI